MLNRTNEKAPAFEIFSGELRIGAAWERQGPGREVPPSVSFEDPSFSSGYYNLYPKRGMDNSYELTFERPRARKDSGDMLRRPRDISLAAATLPAFFNRTLP